MRRMKNNESKKWKERKGTEGWGVSGCVRGCVSRCVTDVMCEDVLKNVCERERMS